MSRTSNPYPWPRQPNPSPHQIFHLPLSATEEQVKSRYYELVRLYHPDKAGSKVSSEDAHTRFQSIGHAYDALRGKKPATLTPVEKATQATTASRRAMHVRRHSALYESGAIDDTWKDRIIIAGIIVTVAIAVFQMFVTRRTALQEAADYRLTTYPHTTQPLPPQEDSRLSSDTTS